MKLRTPLIGGLICLAVSILACSESGSSHEINMYVTAKSGLLIRADANTNASKLGLAPYGAQVRVMEQSENTVTIGGRTGHWTRIQYNDIEGWSFGGYLSATPADQGSQTEAGTKAFQSDFEKKLKPADPDAPYEVGYWTISTDSVQFLTDGSMIFAESAGGACAEIDGVLRCFPVNGHYHVTYSGRNGNTLTYRLGKSVTGPEGENGNIRYFEGKELIIRFLTDTKISVSAGGIEQTYEYTLREAINDYPGP